MKIYRHGDLLIREVKEIPKNLKKKEGNVLAEGETTGHAHRLQVAEKQFQLLEDKEGRLYFEVKKETPLTHEEHKTITVEPGIYVVEHEREYDPFLESIKQVQD